MSIIEDTEINMSKKDREVAIFIILVTNTWF